MNKLQQLYQKQKQQANVQEYLQIRQILQEVYDIVCYHWDESDDRRIKDMIKLSSYPKMKLDENDPHEDKIITEINLYPQIEGETSQFELLQNLALLKNPQQKDMLDALIHSTYGFFKIIVRDDIKALTTLENIFTNEVITLTDLNLGAFGQLSQAYLYLHIIHYHDIYTQSGLCMTFVQSEEVDQWLKSNKNTFMKPYDINQLLLVENYYRKNGLRQIQLRRVTR